MCAAPATPASSSCDDNQQEPKLLAPPGSYYCVKCMEETTPGDSFPAGGSGQVLKRKCRGCKSVQNALDNRSKQNPKLRQALKRKSKEQRAQYFRDKKKQRVGIPNGVGHNFDDLEYEEKEVSYVGDEFRRRVLWKPYAVWRDERKQKAIDTAEIDETDEVSMELW